MLRLPKTQESQTLEIYKDGFKRVPRCPNRNLLVALAPDHEAACLNEKDDSKLVSIYLFEKFSMSFSCNTYLNLLTLTHLFLRTYI